LVKSQKFTSAYYGNAKNWGVMEEENVNRFLSWLQDYGLEKKPLSYEDIVFQDFA